MGDTFKDCPRCGELMTGTSQLCEVCRREQRQPDPDVVAEARRLRALGLSYRAVGETLGFSEAKAMRILKGAAKPDVPIRHRIDPGPRQCKCGEWLATPTGTCGWCDELAQGGVPTIPETMVAFHRELEPA